MNQSDFVSDWGYCIYVLESNEIIVRFLIFFFGLCVLSLGIATVTNAGLGTGTVSSVAFVLNRLADFSMGFFVFLTNVFFFVLQIIVDSKGLLKKALR